MAERDINILFRRKVRDRAIALLLVGFAFFMPPLASFATVDGRIGGVPFTLVFMFTVWAVLIAGAVLLARPLIESEDPPTPEPGNDARR